MEVNTNDLRAISLNGPASPRSSSPAVGWQLRELARVGKCYRGVSYDPQRDLSRADTRYTVRLLRSNNVQDGSLNLMDIQFVHKSRVSEDQKLRGRDVVLCMANGSRELVGKSALFDIDDSYSYTFGAFMGCFRTNPTEADPKFIGYLLQSQEFQAKVHIILSGSSINNLRPGDVESIAFTMPDTREQGLIAEALADVDRLLGALEALIAKKRAIKQATMQQLLTGKTRLPGFSGEWEVKRLGRHVRFLRHGTNSRAELTDDGPVRYLHYGDIHTSANVFLDPQVTLVPRLPINRAVNLDRLEDGDLVVVDASEDVDGVGKSVEITNTGNLEVVSGLHTISARFDKAVLADGFKAYLQFCPPFQQHLKKLAAGTKVYATNRAHIASVELPLPGTDEQIAIATVLSDMDAEIVALEARCAKTHAIKQGVMQQLLTGRVRMVEPTIGRPSAC